MMTVIRTLIIDDERSSRAELKRMISEFAILQVVGEAANADDAETLIKIQKPDLLFLDIQMPERSGFDLLQSLESVPYVIFTTAFDQYAIKAFEINAIDYLLKPIRSERLSMAVERISTKFKAERESGHLFVKDKDDFQFLSWAKVHLVESMDNYAKLFFEDKHVLFKSSLNQLDGFFRCNRAQMVNLNFIAKITNNPNSKLTIELKSGQKIELSERRSIQFRAFNKA
jgi:two-component system LytT family response regulator